MSSIVILEGMFKGQETRVNQELFSYSLLFFRASPLKLQDQGSTGKKPDISQGLEFACYMS